MRRGLVVLLLLTFAWNSNRGCSEEPAKPAEGKTVRVAGIVLKWIRGDKEANYQRAEPLIREAAHQAQIVVTTSASGWIRDPGQIDSSGDVSLTR
ncbi:MAG: hypothetical protein U0903_07010 [Planctomycetales bacterium]